MVTVRLCTSAARIVSIISGSRRPLVERQRVISGKAARTSLKVSKVRGLARGSPGPAMPTTLSRAPPWFSMWRLTRATRSTACAGVSTRLVTPGRLSLAQSKRRSQKPHLMLHPGATGR